MNQSFRESTDGDFKIQTFGGGDPQIMCIGGLAYAPSDFERLATLLDGTTHIVNNPLHKGVVEYTEGWQQWLHDEYVRICQHLGIDFLLGHSGGSFDALAVANRLRLQGIIMLAPAFKNPGRGIIREGRTGTNDFKLKLLDHALEALCEDLPDDLYMPLLYAHFTEYGHRGKEIYKREVAPLVEMCSRILDIMRESRNQPILVIVGEKDPWSKDVVLPEGERHISVVKILGASHFLHVEKAAQTATGINAWTQGIMNRTVAATADGSQAESQPREAVSVAH